jgi:hypothetical protein
LCSIELFKIGRDKTGVNTCDTVYIKDSNSVAVSSGGGGKRGIAIIDIESQKVMTTIPMSITTDYIHVPIIVYRDTKWIL